MELMYMNVACAFTTLGWELHVMGLLYGIHDVQLFSMMADTTVEALHISGMVTLVAAVGCSWLICHLGIPGLSFGHVPLGIAHCVCSFLSAGFVLGGMIAWEVEYREDVPKEAYMTTLFSCSCFLILCSAIFCILALADVKLPRYQSYFYLEDGGALRKISTEFPAEGYSSGAYVRHGGTEARVSQVGDVGQGQGQNN